MVRSLGVARAAALIGVTAEACNTAPTRTERSRKFQGARLGYSRNECSGSRCVATVMGLAVARFAVLLAHRVFDPAHQLAHVEGFAQQGAGMPLEPPRDRLDLGVTGHDRDAALALPPLRHHGQIQRESR